MPQACTATSFPPSPPSPSPSPLSSSARGRRRLLLAALLLAVCTLSMQFSAVLAAEGAFEKLSPESHPTLHRRVTAGAKALTRALSDGLAANPAITRRGITEDIEQIIEKAIEDTIIGILQGINITDIEIAITNMHLPEIFVTLDTPLLNVTLGIASQNLTEIDVLLTAPYEEFDVSLNSAFMPMDVVLSSNMLPLNVSLGSETMPMNVTIESTSLPMLINMSSNSLPMNVAINGDNIPMNVALKTEEMPLTVNMDTIEIGAISWVMLSILLVVQILLGVLLYFHHRQVRSLQAVTKTLQTGSAHSFCTECGTRNGTTAKFCFVCGTKMMRSVLSVDAAPKVTMYGSVQYTQLEDSKH